MTGIDASEQACNILLRVFKAVEAKGGKYSIGDAVEIQSAVRKEYEIEDAIEMACDTARVVLGCQLEAIKIKTDVQFGKLENIYVLDPEWEKARKN